MSDQSGGTTDNAARAARILNAAETLIIRYGYDKTTVSDIAREAGVSKGAIYLHWKSKDDLFEALFQRTHIAYAERWFDLMRDDPTAGSYGSILRNILLAMQASDLMMALFKRDRAVLGSFVRKDRSALDQKGAVNTQLLTLMQEAGVVRNDVNVEVMAHLINILSYGMVAIDDIIPPEESPPIEDVIAEMGEVIDRAITPPDADLEAGKALILQVLGAAMEQMKRAQQLPET